MKLLWRDWLLWKPITKQYNKSLKGITVCLFGNLDTIQPDLITCVCSASMSRSRRQARLLQRRQKVSVSLSTNSTEVYPGRWSSSSSIQGCDALHVDLIRDSLQMLSTNP